MTVTIARTGLEALTTLSSLIDGAPLTPQQRQALSSWTGWGPLAPAFTPAPAPQWEPITSALEDLFAGDPRAMAQAAAATDASFYTPAWLVDAMFDVLRATGFTGGSVLEPGCGSGRFMSQTPTDLPITWTGVESDPTSAKIAAALHPEATIINQPLERTSLRPGSFDAAIGNVPFSAVAPYDPEMRAGSLHEYFMRRAIDAVRPGGYVIVITSRYAIDSEDTMDAITTGADLLGAVRLPSKTFHADGTDVVADILILRKHDLTSDRSPLAWNDHAERTPEGAPSHYGLSYHARPASRRLRIMPPAATSARDSVAVNRYWEVHPDHVAGTMTATGFAQSPLRVHADDIQGATLAALTAASKDLQPASASTVDAVNPFADLTLVDDLGRKEGSFHLDGSEIIKISAGAAEHVARPGAELRALIELRDAAVSLLDADAVQATRALDGPDLAAPQRAAAHQAYTRYVSTYGPLNRGTLHEGAVDPETGEPKWTWRRPTMGGFRRDPDYLTVMALEHYDADTATSAPAPILLRPINRSPKPIERVTSAGEALSVTLGERGTLDLLRVASLLGLDTPDQAITALGDLVYADPAAGGAPVTAQDYLSGDVRSKLKVARSRARTDPTYQRNVTALESALPADFGPLEIRPALGAPWIPADDVKDFISDVLGASVTVSYTPVVNVWELGYHGSGSASARIEYGTNHKTPFDLVECALNGKTPTVWDEVFISGGYRKVRNTTETMAAEEKLQALQERFATWLWEDGERAARLTAEFNRRFRSHVPRNHNGEHLTFPDLADEVSLWPWQRDIIDRIASSPATLCGHAVGSGKTLSMVGAAMTLRRFGLANKPMIAVPGHLLEQIAREAQQAFPTGKFLIASKEDLTKDARRLFAARCLTGDWDAVIITHESFTSLPVAPEIEARWIDEQKYALSDLNRATSSQYSTSKGSKAIATAQRRLEARLEALRDGDRDEDAVRFEQLGVDFLAVDEAHYFKRLSTPTRAEGFSMGASKRATDLLLKINTLAQRRGGRPHVALFTGTPWSNTMAETFVWQTYLQPERLREAGLDSFDAWAAMFVKYETRVEVTPEGSGFRMHRRPSQITNVRTLMSMLGEVADLLSSDQLPLVRPDARQHTIAVEPTGQQEEFVAGLARRADVLRSGVKTNDNMLVICSDGRRVALDPELAGIGGRSPKVTAAAAKIAQIYHANRARTFGDHPTPGMFQLVLCDLGTPGAAGTQTYGRLRAALISGGVPAAQIRFAHDATTDKARAALFASCRDGSTAVLIGSTSKVGVGTNIQTRLGALHHIDAPWRPSDIAQREGRAIRPGNLNASVEVYRYVTQRTFDAYMWQTLERKARFIHALTSADVTADVVDDFGEQVLSFGEVKALAAGNPLLMDHAERVADVRRLRVLRSVHLQTVNQARKNAQRSERDAAQMTVRLVRLDELQAKIVSSRVACGTDSSTRAIRESILSTGRSHYSRPRFTWGPVEVETEANDDDSRHSPVAALTIKFKAQEIGRVLLDRKRVRAHPSGTTYVAGALTEWVEGIDRLIQETASQVKELHAHAASETAAADGATFSRADDLAAAESLLREVETAMEAEATVFAAA